MLYDHVHISHGVSKLGADIPSVNLPVGCTCRKDAPCFKKCYARRGRFCFSRNRAYLQTNLELWCCDPEFYEREVTIGAFPARFFRWHSSGDIPDMAYLEMMVRVATKLPETRFLAFTKKYELVNSYIAEHGGLPRNLNIVLSAWGDFVPDNPHNLPVAYISFKHEAADIPADARPCQSYCGDCVATGMSCWDLKRGESVVFNEH
jgi:hypothetical protein